MEPQLTDVAEGPEPLLQALESFVKSQGDAPYGEAGSVAVGVARNGGVCWWQAELGATVRSGFVDSPSESITAGLVLHELGAWMILERGSLGHSSNLAKVYGNRDYLTRFLDRYLSSGSAVALRCSSKAKSGGPQ